MTRSEKLKKKWDRKKPPLEEMTPMELLREADYILKKAHHKKKGVKRNVKGNFTRKE